MTKETGWIDTLSLIFSTVMIGLFAVWTVQGDFVAKLLETDRSMTWQFIRSSGITAYVLFTVSTLWGLALSSKIVKDWSPGTLSMLLHTTVSWPVGDSLRSVRVEVDDTLSVNAAQSYAPFGDPFGTQGSLGLPYAFTGEVRDSNGLQYHRARYYNPALGMWPSLDPVENLNRYQYVGANPTNSTDPSGLQSPEEAEHCYTTCWNRHATGYYSELFYCYSDCLDVWGGRKEPSYSSGWSGRGQSNDFLTCMEFEEFLFVATIVSPWPGDEWVVAGGTTIPRTIPRIIPSIGQVKKVVPFLTLQLALVATLVDTDIVRNKKNKDKKRPLIWRALSFDPLREQFNWKPGSRDIDGLSGTRGGVEPYWTDPVEWFGKAMPHDPNPALDKIVGATEIALTTAGFSVENTPDDRDVDPWHVSIGGNKIDMSRGEPNWEGSKSERRQTRILLQSLFTENVWP